MGRRIFNSLFVVWRRGEVLSQMCRIILQESKHRLQQRTQQFSSVIMTFEELRLLSRSVIKSLNYFAASSPEDYLQRLKHENLPVSFNQSVN